MKNNIMYSKIKKSTLLLAVMFLVVSCDGYLDEQPTTLIDADYIYTTEDGLKSGVVSLYKFDRDRYDRSTEDYMGAVLLQSRSDLTFSRSGYTGLMGRYERGISPVDYGSNLASTLFWKHFYNMTNKATDIINAAEVVEGVDTATKNQIIAEAKFFRAHSYFFLYRMYNNIFVTTKSVTVENAFDVVETSSTKEEIFSLINSDLQFAVDNLQWNVSFGRISKGTAKHVKAKVAMWQGDWAEAKKQALDVIEDPMSPHSLVATTAEVFKGDKNNSEQLYVIQTDNELLGGGDVTMMNANFVTQYFQIPGIVEDLEQGGRGFSRVIPNNYLLDLLAEDPNDTRDDNTYFRLNYFYNDVNNLPAGKNVGDVIDIYKPISAANPDGDQYQRYFQRLHPSCVKFNEEDDDATSYRNRTSALVYRLAETYLIAAEAIMRSSGDPLPYINAVRTRANAAPVTTISEQIILDERARELSFEGQRWFTLKRMGQEVINRQIRTYAGAGDFYPANLGSKDPRTNWQDHFINWPIFQEDLDLLGPNYPQNLGY
ncbi:RagB/SusD family nutrient uptake outer membrane protein [Polaribacter vadi]|mgnify:FL=1|uniref:RagB/SusD family nutrient uptake outer membrane protein n=1 Tax=Polaribacter vadi TaxID=1774273 RepID=UPI0030EE0D4C|tara:strand:- start:1316 stop:2941 length:1626 start_codon:yes stop_codon:yes gene_type:complete